MDEWDAEACPECLASYDEFTGESVKILATRAAQWGADQELEACVKLLELSDKNARDFLYSARRPKPLSLKQQGLQALGRFISNAHTNGDEMMRDFDLIRQALQEIKDED